MLNKTACTAVLLSALPLAAPAAELDFFLKLDTIAGESKDAKHKDEIDVTSWSWGLSNTGTTIGGGGGAGKPKFTDFSWSQGIDRSVAPLFVKVANGTHFQQARLDVTRTDGAGANSFFQLAFTQAFPTQLDISGAGNTQSATAALNFGTVTIRYRPQDAMGGYGAWIEGGFNVQANRVLFFGDPQALEGLALAGGGGMPLAVPEPQSWALLLAGLLATGAWVRRRTAAAP